MTPTEDRFPSKIVSVKTKHLMAVLMEQHLPLQFLHDCIDEAEKRTNDGHHGYSQLTEENAVELAARI